MSDIVQDFTEYRIRQIELAEARYYESLIKTLDKIEKEIIDKEQDLITEELKNSGKPDEIAKKISLGKLNKFKEENSLMTQDWVMEPKKKVRDILKEINVSDLKVVEFLRIKIGE